MEMPGQGSWTVYVLRSEATGRFYVGHTGDLAQRLDYHNRGLSRWTRGKGPWTVAYTETFLSRSGAAARERQLKAWKSRKSIEELIRDNERP